MHRLSACELLDTWESSLVQAPVQKALTLLAASHPETRPDDLAALSIGARDACLLGFREQTFGSLLVGLTHCPRCGERLEVSFNASDLRAPSRSAESADLSLHAGGFDVRFRPPNSFDLLAIAGCKDVQSGRTALLRRCVLQVQQNGVERDVDDLPAAILDEVVKRMGEADPQADVQLALSCPSCAHKWQDGFDIVSFLWSEINAWAYRTLRDVHTLASAYGWRESEILALSPGRRQAYLEMVGQ